MFELFGQAVGGVLQAVSSNNRCYGTNSCQARARSWYTPKLSSLAAFVLQKAGYVVSTPFDEDQYNEAIKLAGAFPAIFSQQ